MRKVNIAGEEIVVNYLVKSDFETFDLGKYGFSFFGYNPISDQTESNFQADGIQKFIEAATGIKEVPKTFGPKHWLKLYAECVKETYGSEEEEKN